jgi:hypothetical protein
MDAIIYLGKKLGNSQCVSKPRTSDWKSFQSFSLYEYNHLNVTKLINFTGCSGWMWNMASYYEDRRWMIFNANIWGKYLYNIKWSEQILVEHYIKRNLVVYTGHVIVRKVKSRIFQWIWHWLARERQGMLTDIWWRNLLGNVHLKDWEIDGTVILTL